MYKKNIYVRKMVPKVLKYVEVRIFKDQFRFIILYLLINNF